MAAVFTRIAWAELSDNRYKLLTHYSFFDVLGAASLKPFGGSRCPNRRSLRQLLDRQEITAVMAAYARWADLNQPEQQAAVFIAGLPGEAITSPTGSPDARP